MPLLDQFAEDMIRFYPWKSFHSHWAARIAELLNLDILPEGYVAVSTRDQAGPIEIDVASFQRGTDDGADLPGEAPPWPPPEPGLTATVEWPAADNARVEILSNAGDPPLVAAIELVSMSNKDRPRSREAFTGRCVDLLARGVGLVVVDVVTNGAKNLHADLLAAPDVAGAPAARTAAVSYRPVTIDGTGQLTARQAELEIGQPLPVLPLWLGGDFSVPLDLEASCAAACSALRIRHAG